MIRLTGDGSEGQCRALLSTYVCDLLWEIISCFANKWNVSSGKRLGADAGIGSIIGILTGAGSDLANEVKGRYGETSTFNAMFNEKEMVHGLCLLAFGMEWNVDVSAMVQQSVASVPVETIVMGPTPCQSRFIAWNPITNPRGLTTWEYHFGLMASAGADITPRVKLKCSSGFDCSESDGFVGGECDCNKGGEQVITITPTCKPAWKSQIKKDELVSLDCTYTAQKAKQRYDTLIFEYDWYDTGTKQRVTKSSKCSINAVGSQPPSFCRFDPLSSSFRCRFGESPSGLRLESITPEYECRASKTDNTQVFALDENPEFELLVSQMMPEEQSEMDQGIKYLGYKITNTNGDVVTEIDPATDAFTIQLKTDGRYKHLVEIPNDGNWKKFFELTGAKSLPVSVWSNDIALSNKIAAKPGDYIGSINIVYTEKNKFTPVKEKFVVDIQGKDLSVYVFGGKADSYFTFSKNIVFDGKGKVKDGETYKIIYQADTDKKYDISFKLIDTKLFGTDRVQFLLDYAKGTPSKDPCTSGEPVTWNAQFTAYDADKYGRVTSQVSVDPKTGEKQSKSTTFKISCFNADDLEETENELIILEAFLIDNEGKKIKLSEEKETKIPIGNYKLEVMTNSEQGNVILFDNLVLDKSSTKHTYFHDLDLTSPEKSDIDVRYVFNDAKKDEKSYTVDVKTSVSILRDPTASAQVGDAPFTQTATGVSCNEIDSCTDYVKADCTENICNINRPYGCFYDVARQTCAALPYRIESVTLMENNIPVAELSTSQINPAKVKTGVTYNMQVKTNTKVPYVYETIYAETGNVLFSATKFFENYDDIFNMKLYSSIARKLRINLAVKDQSDILLATKDYWVEFAKSMCSESEGICADSCTDIARIASDFSCDAGRECCVSPYMFKNGKQVPTSCTDYGGFCSNGCDSTETEIPYYRFGCDENSVCCISTDYDDSCPGVCASSCSQMYDDLGKSDCPSGSTCCAD